MKFYLFLLTSLLSMSCLNKASQNKECHLKSMQTLFTVASKKSGYTHNVFVRDIFRNCMDSSIHVSAAMHYIDTVRMDHPVSVLKFYNSERYWGSK